MIENQLLVINLHISCYGGNKTDKEASLELASTHQSNPKSARVVKKLFADSESLKKIRNLAVNCRQKIASKTYPYHVPGAVLCPVGHALEVIGMINRMKDDFFHLVHNFVENEYDAMVEKTKKDLNSLWRDGDIPSKDSFRSYFDFRIDVASIPQPDDLDKILGIENIIEEQKEIMQDRLNSLEQEIVKISIARISKACELVLSRLRNFTGKRGGTFRKELLLNAHETGLAELKSNITKHQGISKWAADLRDATQHQPDSYKLDAVLRSETVSKLSQIIKDIESATK